jgi:endonuclease YncB( thermonuclease family)
VFAAILALALLGGCGRLGPQPPAPRTPAAERASWPRPPAAAVPAVVAQVVDGDTFVAVIGGRRDPVRVIGVDTPETVAPGRPVEPYGKQASAFAHHWLDGTTVRLAGDVEPRDRYGRLLAYVWLADGTFWNALLAAEGYAEQLTIPPNVAFAELLGRLVAQARTRRHGLWAGDQPGAGGTPLPLLCASTTFRVAAGGWLLLASRSTGTAPAILRAATIGAGRRACGSQGSVGQAPGRTATAPWWTSSRRCWG